MIDFRNAIDLYRDTERFPEIVNEVFGNLVFWLIYTILLPKSKDFPAFRVVLVRHLTAATAAITLALLLVEMLCYVLRRLHSSCVLSTKIGQHRGELLNKTLVNDDFSKKIEFSIYLC